MIYAPIDVHILSTLCNNFPNIWKNDILTLILHIRSPPCFIYLRPCPFSKFALKYAHIIIVIRFKYNYHPFRTFIIIYVNFSLNILALIVLSSWIRKKRKKKQTLHWRKMIVKHTKLLNILSINVFTSGKQSHDNSLVYFS